MIWCVAVLHCGHTGLEVSHLDVTLESFGISINYLACLHPSAFLYVAVAPLSSQLYRVFTTCLLLYPMWGPAVIGLSQGLSFGLCMAPSFLFLLLSVLYAFCTLRIFRTFINYCKDVVFCPAKYSCHICFGATSAVFVRVPFELPPYLPCRMA